MSQQINLYEARLRPSHELATARNLGMAAVVLLVLMTVLAAWTGSTANRKSEDAALSRKQLVDEQEKLAALSKLVGQRKVSPALTSEIDAAKALLTARQDVMDVLDSGKLGNTSGFSALMSGFARQAQTDLWLTGFAVLQGGEEIEIRGRLLDPAKLPAYVQRLSSEPVFKGRRFAALEMRDINPEEQKTDQSGNMKAAEKAPGAGIPQQPAARLLRFTEFVLRSENSAALDAAYGGLKP